MLTFFLCTALAAAEPPPAEGQIIAASRDWTVTFDAARAWTIHHIDYRGTTVSHANGFHGAVIDTGQPLEPGKPAFIGTGHTEGGREQVESVSLELNGEPVPLEIGRRYEGRFVLRKRSMIGHLRHDAEITVADDRLLEHHRFEALAEQPLKLMYAFMHCWQPTFTRWTAVTPEGEALHGELNSDNDFEINRDVAWSAIYDPAAEVGMVTAYPEPPRSINRGLGTRYWDLARYHKQYLHILGAGPIPAGTVYDWTLCLQGFRAPEADWGAAATRLAESAFEPAGGPAAK